MPHVPSIARPPHSGSIAGPSATARLALIALSLAFAFGLVRLGAHGLAALGYPYGLDYGEGTVWQQMRGIVAGAGYAPLGLIPGFVYEYPPLYHLVTAAVARTWGLDELLAGRAVSLAAALACAGLIGLLSAAMLRPEVSQPVRCGVAAIAALAFATLPVVLTWSVLMRVDMLACALTLAGMVLAARGAARPAVAAWAGLAFAAAIYTRQTCLPAPAAAFVVLVVARPRAAWLMLGAAVTAGGIALVVLSIATHGQFLVHIVLYNINRIVWAHAPRLALVLIASAVPLALGGIGLAVSLRRLDPANWRTLRARLRADPALVAAAIVTGMLVLKTLTLPAILKSGASDNYLLDWFAALAVLTGVAAAPAVRSALDGGSRPGPALLLLLGAGVPVQMIDPPLFPAAQSPADRATMTALVARVAASARPVVSDDMVLLLRAGKPVIWEPAIIAELGAAAQYDEAALARLVRRGDFGFFVTAGVAVRCCSTSASTRRSPTRWPRRIHASGPRAG